MVSGVFGALVISYKTMDTNLEKFDSYTEDKQTKEKGDSTEPLQMKGIQND